MNADTLYEILERLRRIESVLQSTSPKVHTHIWSSIIAEAPSGERRRVGYYCHSCGKTVWDGDKDEDK